MTKKYKTTLFDHLNSNPFLKISKRLKIWEKVAERLMAQQKKYIRHYDLKGMNIFVDVEQNDVKELVIADFGIGAEQGYSIHHHCGTPGVGSPEQFTSLARQESDIFSLGKLSLQIIFPWDTFWGIIGSPVDQSQIDKFRKTHKLFEKFHNLISSMLKVGLDKD